MLYSVHSKFWDALKYTVLLAGVVIPIEVGIAITLAMLLTYKFRGRDLAVYVVVLPLVISDVAAGLIWYSMLTGGAS